MSSACRSAVSRTAACTESIGTSSTRASWGTIWNNDQPSGIVIECSSPLPPRMSSSTSPHEPPRLNTYVPARIERSLPRSIPYRRNAVAFWTTPAFARDSAATRSVAPRGTSTRTSPLPEPRHAVSASAATMPPSTIRRPARRPTLCRCFDLGARRFVIHGGQRCHSHRLLQQHRRGERVDVALSPTRASPHLADRAERGRGGESLVDQRDGEAGAARELGGDAPALGRARRVLPFAVQGKSHHDRAGFE